MSSPLAVTDWARVSEHFRQIAKAAQVGRLAKGVVEGVLERETENLGEHVQDQERDTITKADQTIKDAVTAIRSACSLIEAEMGKPLRDADDDDLK